MRNNIKLLAIVIILCLVFESSAFAGIPQNLDKAETLKSLNLIVGTNKGFELDKVFTRAQGTVIVIKLLGMDSSALKAGLKSPFSDVSKSHWASKHVSFAFQNGIVYGTAAKQFSPNRQMTGAELTTLILRGLGYKEASPKTAASLAVQSGLLQTKEAAALTSKKVFLRDDMILVVYRALTTKLKTENKTLLQSLVEKKAVSREAAIASGLYFSMQPVILDPMDQIEDAIRRALEK